MPVSITVLRNDGEVVFANREATTLTGYDRDKIVGRSFWLETVHPEDAWKLTDSLRRAGRGDPIVVVFRFLSRRGPRLVEMHLFRASDGLTLQRESSIEAVAFDVTERSEVEEALYQSEALYRTFLEQSPIGMLHLDAAGTVTFENHQFRQIIGEDAADAWIGRTIFSIEGLDDRVRSRIRALLEVGDHLDGEMTAFRRSPSRVQHLKLHGSPIHHPDGGIVGSVIMVEDRSEEVRRREELELRGRYDEAKSALRKAALSETDDSAFLKRAARILGECTRADQVYLLQSNATGDCCTDRGRWFRDGGDDLPPLVILLSDHVKLQSLEAGNSLHLLRSGDESGRTSLLEITGAEEAVCVAFWDDRRLAGYALVERNDRLDGDSSCQWSDSEVHLIETLIRLFETLWSWRLAGSRYKQITAAIDDCLFTFTFDEDAERRYLFVTDQIERLAGWPASSLTTHGENAIRWSDEIVHEDDRHVVDGHDETLRGGEESKITYRIQQPDGEVRWIREHAMPERDAMGDVMVSGILTDVTEQKTAEQVLTDAKLQAESANQLKTAFIATMSHEIRTPMGALNGFAELLGRELVEHQERSGSPLPPQVSEFLDVIQDNSRRLLTMVNELFDLSNLEAGSVELRTTDVPLNEVVKRSAQKVGPSLAEKNVELRMDLDDSDPQVTADARRLEQVMDNLLSNAVKFTDVGLVGVRTGRQHDGRPFVEVSDTGVGISDSYIDQLFEPFAQEDSRLNRQFQGTGLGLSLSKRLLDLMDGSIEVSSEKGQGSRFTVSLPAARRSRAGN